MINHCHPTHCFPLVTANYFFSSKHRNCVPNRWCARKKSNKKLCLSRRKVWEQLWGKKAPITLWTLLKRTVNVFSQLKHIARDSWLIHEVKMKACRRCGKSPKKIKSIWKNSITLSGAGSIKNNFGKFCERENISWVKGKFHEQSVVC